MQETALVSPTQEQGLGADVLGTRIPPSAPAFLPLTGAEPGQPSSPTPGSAPSSVTAQKGPRYYF